MSHQVLYIFAGLPGSGKTTLARKVAKELRAAYLRIDTIEQGMRDLCSFPVQGEGYRLAYRLAKDILSTGVSVVADQCNPLILTRDEWELVARELDSKFMNIEVLCSDLSEHKRRVETRMSNIVGLRLPTWGDVESREYHAWDRDRIVIDTAGKSEDEAFCELLNAINKSGA